jgi:hypothetical protein
MIALLVLAALAMVAALIAGIVALVVTVIRYATVRNRKRRNHTGSRSGLPHQDAVSREDAEFRRIVHQEWPSS